jgi:HD-GYP domain-containing protein (c-di-GMP phosphodiesterase class II)
VSDIAVQIAQELGLKPERVVLVRRAALLHDLGKLRVPNTILDKRGDLTADEWKIVLEHPALTRSILERVSSFRELAAVAGEHHEKVDGSGYPLGLKGEEMSIEARLLGVADCYTALAEERPYRESIEPGEILRMMQMSVPNRLDGACYSALARVVARWEKRKPVKKQGVQVMMPEPQSGNAATNVTAI